MAANFQDQLANISRRRGMADALRQRGLKQSGNLGQTQMVSGYAIPNKGGAELNAILSQLLGTWQDKKLGAEEDEIKEQQREDMKQWAMALQTVGQPDELQPIQIDTSTIDRSRVTPETLGKIDSLNERAQADTQADIDAGPNRMYAHLLEGLDKGGYAEQIATARLPQMGIQKRSAVTGLPGITTDGKGNFYDTEGKTYSSEEIQELAVEQKLAGSTAGTTGPLAELDRINAEREAAGEDPLATEDYLATRRDSASNMQMYRSYVNDAIARGETNIMDELQYATLRAENMAGATTTGKGMAQRQLDLPQAWAARSSATQNFTRLTDAVDVLDNDEDLWKAVGASKVALMSLVPGTEGADVLAKIDNIKSQVGFMVLQDMRNASKTGGALGQVSERENILLQENLAALSTDQSPAEFRKSLKVIKKYLREAQYRLDHAWSLTYPEMDNYGRPAEDDLPPPANDPNIPVESGASAADFWKD